MITTAYKGIDKHFLAKQLKYFRNASGRSSVETAKIIGISPAAYSKYECEKVEYPTEKFIQKLLKAYPNATEKDFVKMCNTTSDGIESILTDKVREWMKTRDGEIYIMQAYLNWLKDNKTQE